MEKKYIVINVTEQNIISQFEEKKNVIEFKNTKFQMRPLAVSIRI